MKFSQLPLGARFRYEGTTYLKTGPMQARPTAGGGDRMMPRWAVLEMDDDTAAPAAPTAGGTGLRPALAAYHQRCLALLAEACPDESRRAATAAALEEARHDLLATLARHD